MPTSHNDGDGEPSDVELEQHGEARHSILKPMYEKYKNGEYGNALSTPFPTLELVPSGELDINRVVDATDGKLVRVNVGQLSDPSRTNFMGYHTEQRCFVFKGQRRLFDDFLVFTTELVKDERCSVVFECPFQVKIPTDGLPRGLDYDEFASHCEVVQYAMWVNSSVDDDTDAASNEINGDCENPNLEMAREVNHNEEEEKGGQKEVSQGDKEPLQCNKTATKKVLKQVVRDSTSEDELSAVTEAKLSMEQKPAATRSRGRGTGGNLSLPTTHGRRTKWTAEILQIAPGVEVVTFDPSLIGGRYPLRKRSSTAPDEPKPQPQAAEETSGGICGKKKAKIMATYGKGGAGKKKK